MTRVTYTFFYHNNHWFGVSEESVSRTLMVRYLKARSVPVAESLVDSATFIVDYKSPVHRTAAELIMSGCCIPQTCKHVVTKEEEI